MSNSRHHDRQWLRNNSSTQLESWTANVGANGVLNNTFTHRCTGTELVYFLSFEGPSDCISYRFNYSVQRPSNGTMRNSTTIPSCAIG
ncbi:MAG: hypothetical protein H6597_00340 [Flavobacteriales bacterium]|nr:hypothetical protein [Flavobacteriales bacterium]